MSMRQAGNFGDFQRRGKIEPFHVALFTGLAFICFTSLAIFVVLSSAGSSDAEGSSPIVVETTSKLETVDVIVPVTSIVGGMALEPSMFTLEARPKVGLSDRTIKNYEEIQGTYAATLILPGQPLHKDYITTVRPVNQITAKIPQGYRAVTINVDVKSSIEGWARAGARVDVAWTTTVSGKRAVQIIVENALVISAGRQIEGSGSQQSSGGQGDVPNQITLMVPIDDAKKITLASGTGTLNLSLRGDRDNGKAEAGIAITEDDLLGFAKSHDKQRPESMVKIRDEKGNFAEFVLRDGELVPY